MRHRRARRTAARERASCRAYHREMMMRAKGRENETKVGEALETLKENDYIVSYFVSIPNGEQDRRGIDAGLTTARGVEVNFQIKSSSRGVKQHLRKHPDIPCVNVHGCVTVREVAVLIRTQFELSQQ